MVDVTEDNAIMYADFTHSKATTATPTNQLAINPISAHVQYLSGRSK
jgi:hypothetical protein